MYSELLQFFKEAAEVLSDHEFEKMASDFQESLNDRIAENILAVSLVKNVEQALLTSGEKLACSMERALEKHVSGLEDSDYEIEKFAEIYEACFEDALEKIALAAASTKTQTPGFFRRMGSAIGRGARNVGERFSAGAKGFFGVKSSPYKGKYDKLSTAHKQTASDYGKLQAEHAKLQKDFEAQRQKNVNLGAQHKTTADNLSRTRKDFAAQTKAFDAHKAETEKLKQDFQGAKAQQASTQQSLDSTKKSLKNWKTGTAIGAGVVGAAAGGAALAGGGRRRDDRDDRRGGRGGSGGVVILR